MQAASTCGLCAVRKATVAAVCSDLPKKGSSPEAAGAQSNKQPFCSANGMTIIILGLVFGRCSEQARVRACRPQLANLPPWVSGAYDKGIRGMRSMLPNFNFVFMPIMGGLMMSSVEYNYDLDAVTYTNAKLSKADMYASQMKLVKTSAYKALGKPNFFG